MSIYENIENLVTCFYRDVEIAKELESGNIEDDLAIKLAIVGFSYNSPIQEWGERHYEYVKARLDKDYHDKELAEYGANSQNVKLFFALGLGYLLGLYQQDQIGDREFGLGETHIPGIIMLHLSKLIAQPV